MSSATAMNSTGGTRPRVGMAPAHQRLERRDAAGRERDDRLVVRPSNSRSLDGAAQVGLDLQPRDRAVAHRRVEELAARVAARLGAVERDGGVAQDLFGPL